MSGKRAARHAQTKSRRRGLIGVAVVVAAIAVALAVALGWLPGTNPGETERDTASHPSSSDDAGTDAETPDGRETPSATPSPENAASSKDARPQALRACAASVREAKRAVQAAGSGVGNWKSHVKARTDMLKGRISEKRMDAIWARTQAAAPRDHKRFKVALRAYDQPSKCRRLENVPASDRRMAARCVQRSRAAARALGSAEAAMHDWGVHLSNMAKYANNKMSASMAQGRWVKAWRKAPRNISAYGEARETLAKAPACPRAP